MEIFRTTHRQAGTDFMVLAILLVTLTVATYMPVFRGGFIWDDDVLITDNPIIKTGNGLYRFWFTTQAPDYYPLTESWCWLEWRALGDQATGYHVVNVLLHAACAVMVWMVLRQLKIAGAWLAALVFAVHPVNVATAAWISEQKNTLSMFFGMLTVLCYLRFSEEGRWRWYGCSLLAFLLALLSKSAVVMIPFVLLGCAWWMRGHVRQTDLLRTAPFFAASLISGLVTIWFQHHRAMEGLPVRSTGFLSRLATAGCIPWFYLYKALLPLNLTVIYPKWQISSGHGISYLPGIVVASCFVVFWWNRRGWGRSLLFGFGYYLVMLFPVLGFIDQGLYRYTLVADHWQYHSIVGVIALTVAAGCERCRRMDGRRRYLGMLLAALVVVALATASWQRSAVYASDESLWHDNVAKNPGAWVAYANLGLNMEWSGNLEAAIGYFDQALQINPDSADAHNNLALALLQLGRTQEAIPHLERALRINPGYADAHANLGNALFQEGRVTEAFSHYHEAVRLDPDSALVHDDLGVALEKLGRAPEAIEQYQQALKLNPDLTPARQGLERLRAPP